MPSQARAAKINLVQPTPLAPQSNFCIVLLWSMMISRASTMQHCVVDGHRSTLLLANRWRCWRVMR
jgi:hypothetical protein